MTTFLSQFSGHYDSSAPGIKNLEPIQQNLKLQKEILEVNF